MNAKPKPGRLFKKGQSGNPSGSSAKSRALGKITKLTNEQVSDVASLLLDGNMPALLTLENSPEAPVLKVWMASLILKSCERGDAATFTALMNRLLGKPREAVELTGKDGAPLNAPESVEAIEARLAIIRAAKAEVGDD